MMGSRITKELSEQTSKEYKEENKELVALIKSVERTTRIMRAVFWISLAVCFALAYPYVDRYIFQTIADVLYDALK